MKLFLLLPFVLLSSCAYDMPQVSLNIGFMGATVGVSVGGQPPKAEPLPHERTLFSADGKEIKPTLP